MDFISVEFLATIVAALLGLVATTTKLWRNLKKVLSILKEVYDVVLEYDKAMIDNVLDPGEQKRLIKEIVDVIEPIKELLSKRERKNV